MKKIISFVMTVLMVSTMTFAQELMVKSLILNENDSSAILKPRTDFNKMPCGLIKVRFELIGASFEGDIVGEPKDTLKEYWVYMPEDSRFLTIHHRNYLPLEISFDDYFKGGVKSGSTYLLEILKSEKDIDAISYSPNELYLLGEKYYKGLNGTKIDLFMGEYFLLRAAELGSLDAQALLGDLFLDRDRGDLEIERRIKSEYIDKKETRKNLKEKWVIAEYWFGKAAEKGNPKAMIGLGKCEMNKVKLVDYKYKNKHRQDAYKWISNALKKGEPTALYWLGYYYDKGFQSKSVIEEPNYKEAFKWYIKSANEGDYNGMRSAAIFYEKGYGVNKDTLKAFWWYQEAAKHGDLLSQYKLGCFYEKGEFVKQGPITAFEYYEIAAKRGHSLSQNQLGECFMKGFGVAKDLDKAIYWFRKAAEQENYESYYWLGKCYDEGIGIMKDEKMALRWYKRSIEGEKIFSNRYHSEALIAVGLKYKEGKIVKENPEYSSDCFIKAAILHNAIAQYYFGIACLRGYGVKQNIELAKKWLKKAASQGYPEAREALKNIENKVLP